MAAPKPKPKHWMPLDIITRNNEMYVYVGDTQNTEKMKTHNKEFNKDQGRKTAFVVDHGDAKRLCIYVSSEFYPGICNVQYPSYGKQTIVRRGVTW